MSTQPNMTEPLVIPTKPNVKPAPKREEVKPKPRRGDPWTVPGPKKNPTPKALKLIAMTRKKKLITSKASFNFCKKHMTKEEFYSKFELSMGLVIQLAAESACLIVDNTDRALTPKELCAEGFGGSLN